MSIGRDPFAYLGLVRDFIGIAIAAGSGIIVWLRTRQAYSWPTTQATVWQASARPAEQRSYIYGWVGELTYSYVVNGEYYAGSSLLKARNERRAQELVSGWKGRTIVLRFSPTRHDISIALKSDQPGGQLGN